jgi:hypothetical protein
MIIKSIAVIIKNLSDSISLGNLAGRQATINPVGSKAKVDNWGRQTGGICRRGKRAQRESDIYLPCVK